MADRAKLLRAIHAEGRKRGMDHDALRDMFKVPSLSNVPVDELERRLKGWTGKGLRRKTPLPRRGYGSSTFVELAGLDEFTTLANAFAIAQMNGEAQKTFISRQLRGRDTVRTVSDFHKVFSGLRAMNRRRN